MWQSAIKWIRLQNMRFWISKGIGADNYIDSLTDKAHIPGIQYIVLDPQRIIYERYAGLSDIKNSISMKAGTTMMAYSMTKTLTAIAILQLVEKGVLELDTGIAKYLPEKPYGGNITIRQLLSHTAGLPNPIPLRWVHLAEKHNNFDENAALAKVLKDHPILIFQPGKKYFYSNIGYWLLGKIIEKATSQSYVEYVRDQILCHLETTDKEIGFTIPDKLNHAKGYLAKYSAFNLLKSFLIDKSLICTYEDDWLHIKNHYVNGPSFGGLVGTARSFAVFLRDQLRSESALFGDQARANLFSQQLNNSGHLINMTLGWHIGILGKTRYFYKEGGGGGFHCEMRLYPFQKFGSVIMINESSAKCRRYQNWLDRVVIGSSLA